eukprot:gene50814-53387_t
MRGGGAPACAAAFVTLACITLMTLMVACEAAADDAPADELILADASSPSIPGADVSPLHHHQGLQAVSTAAPAADAVHAGTPVAARDVMPATVPAVMVSDVRIETAPTAGLSDTVMSDGTLERDVAQLRSQLALCRGGTLHGATSTGRYGPAARVTLSAGVALALAQALAYMHR